MIVDRVFWRRTKGTVTQAFSYAKDSQAEKFADKWGGDVIASIPIDDSDVDQLEQYGKFGEVWSILHNSSPQTTKDDTSGKEFTVWAYDNGPLMRWIEIGSYNGISPANTKAKEVIANYPKVLVIKND